MYKNVKSILVKITVFVCGIYVKKNILQKPENVIY